MLLTGAEIIVEAIREHGVDTVFGLPGGSVLPLLDALYHARESVSFVLTAHEQAAAFAADGYARVSRNVGVCVATGGPGATNLCTGIAAAYMDSVPVVCLTGNIRSERIGTDSFQEIDILGMTIPITKHNYQVRSIDRLLPCLREAFSLAVTGRPGPVLVDIAVDVQQATAQYSPPKPPESAAAPAPLRTEKILACIQAAQAPLILAGGGVTRAGAESRIAELAQRLDAPVVTTLMGLGAIPDSHPLALGPVGLHGRREANQALSRADLLIAVGTRFSERSQCEWGLPSGRPPVLHIDIDHAEIGKNLPADYSLVGDAREILDRLLLRLPDASHPEWRDWLAGVRSRRQGDAPAAFDGSPLNLPEQMIRALARLAGPDAVVCTDVGQHQMWVMQHYGFEKPGKLITSGGAGAMGYGLGAAIGAQFAAPEKRVILVTGDGSFQMNAAELATVARYRLPITILVFNNGTLGLVRQLQHTHCERRYFATDLPAAPNFVKLAEAYGLPSDRVETLEDFCQIVTLALESREASVIDCRIPAADFVRGTAARWAIDQ